MSGVVSDLPSVAELVQREVKLVGPHDVVGLLENLQLKDWDVVVETA